MDLSQEKTKNIKMATRNNVVKYKSVRGEQYVVIWTK